MLGELFRVRAHSWPSRAKKIAYSALRRGALKPTTPMLAPEQQPLKPTTPLHPETAPKTLVSRPQRWWRFQSHACTHKQRRWRFQTSVLPVVQTHRQATRLGPGCGTRGRRQGLTAHSDKPRPIGGRRGACGAWPGFETTRRATRQHTQPHWCGGRRRDRRARAGFEARRRTK
ncbi:hypothetical protein FBF35_09135 [Schaalia odontolytica]|nr:hypothetical protein FBF35_09135 [Schaalia odontolytica]